MSHPAVTSTIIGPKTPAQLDDSLAASEVTLSADVLDAIDGVVRTGTDVPGIVHFTGNPSTRPRNRRR